MKKALVIFVSAIILAGYLVSCSTKVDLNAAYTPFTVVFGLLDAGQDTQFVKINKTWLGEGNNLVFAQVRDSSEYDFDEFDAVVEEWVDGNFSDSWPLDSITRYDKDDEGLFYGPEYTAYYFVPEGGINQSATYNLEIDFFEKGDVSSTTDIIGTLEGNANITQPPAGLGTYKFNLATVSGNGTQYNDFIFKWGSNENGKRYEVSLNVHYTEYLWEDDDHTVLVEEKDHVLNWFLGTVTASDTEGGQVMTKEINWQSFYLMLANQLDADPKITRQLGIWNEDVQKAEVFDFILTIANDELNTFMEINEPVTGIIQERPEYTNVTNGLGLFASRAQQIVSGIGMTGNSVEVLVLGEHTSGLNFCFPNPFDDFYCEE